MRAWQAKAQSAIAGLLRDLGQHPVFHSVELAEYKPLDHREGDVYLEATVSHGARRFQIFIYNDEAGVDIDGTWHPFELPDWNNDPQELLEGVLVFLRNEMGDNSKEAS